MCNPVQSASIQGGPGQILSSGTAAPKAAKNAADKAVEKALGKPPKSPAQARQDGLKALTQKPVSSLGGTAKTGVAARPEKIRLARIKEKAGLPDTFRLKLPPAGASVDLDTRVIAKEVLARPKDGRAWAVQAFPEKVQRRIDNGFKVYEQIRKGEAQTPARLTDIRDFMTYLTARASQKAGYFEQGAFNLPDPGNKIRNFLDSCTGVYQRKSTHIEEFVKQKGCGHRGIDVPKLPHGLGTLLYGAMKDGVEGTKGDRIFLKMEDHGCRFSGLSKNKRDAQGPKTDRKRNFLADLIKSLKHGWGGLKTKLGLQKVKGTRKERVPEADRDRFNALVKTALKHSTKIGNLLNDNKPAGKETGHGFRTMITNIDGLLAPGNNPTWQSSEELKDLRQQLAAFKDDIMARFDHVTHRIGNEIVFNEGELGGNQDLSVRVRDYLANVPLEKISPFYLEQECGKGNMVIGKTACSLFKDGLPEAIDQDAANAQAKKDLEQDLGKQVTWVTKDGIGGIPLSKESIDLELGKQFINDFNRLGLTVNGQRLGKGPNINEDLKTFVDLVGGKEKARVISKVMHQNMLGIVFSSFARSPILPQVIHDPMFIGQNGPKGEIVQEVTVREDGRVELSAKENIAAANGIIQSKELEATISGLDDTPRVDDAKIALMFVSPD